MNTLITTPVRSPRLHLGAPTDIGGFSLFPVWTDRAPTARPVTTAIPRGVTIGEVDEGPRVGTLTVANPTDKVLLLVEGWLVVGGWQSRTLVNDYLIPARTRLDVAVRCVEQGRWGGDPALADHGRRAPVGVRGALRGIRAERPHGDCRGGPVVDRADQGDVWTRVRAYEGMHGPSPTGSLIDTLDGAGRIHLPRLEPLSGQQGVLIAAAGHPVMLEVFDHPRQFAQQLPRIVESLAADLPRIPVIPNLGRRARTFAAACGDRVLDPAAPAGAGTLVEVGDGLVDMRALVDPTGCIQHLSVLNRRHQLVRA